MKTSAQILAFCLVVGVSGATADQSHSNVYSNKFVGLSFAVPDGWYAATDNEVKELMPDGARVMGLDDPAARATVAQMPGKVLLMVSERPFTSDVQAVNRNIIFVAMNVREMKNAINSGADYLRDVVRGLKESQPTAQVSDITAQRLGDQVFDRVTAVLPIQGIAVHMSQVARIHNDYLVVLNMAAESQDGLSTLIQNAESLRLSSVPVSLDQSAEGIAFRKQATLAIPRSSGNPLLKNIGLVLIIGGALLFLRNLFRKR